MNVDYARQYIEDDFQFPILKFMYKVDFERVMLRIN